MNKPTIKQILFTADGIGDKPMQTESDRTEASIQPIDDWVRKCEGLEKQLSNRDVQIKDLNDELECHATNRVNQRKQLASAEDWAKRAEVSIFELLERYLDCVTDWHEYHHTSEFNDCQVEVCKNARVAVKDYEDAKGAI